MLHTEEVMELLKPGYQNNLVVTHAPVGSQVTCSPPPGEGSDEDWLVLFANEDTLKRWIFVAVKEQGFVPSSDLDYEACKFFSIENGDLNLILTANADFYWKFILARDVCQRLNLLNRGDRVLVHAAVRDGCLPEGRLNGHS